MAGHLEHFATLTRLSLRVGMFQDCDCNDKFNNRVG